MKRILFLLLALFFFFVQKAKSQNISNEGTEFWAVFPTHDPGGVNGESNLANMNILVSSKANSEVTVSCNGYLETQSIPANTIITFSIPRANSYINREEGNVLLNNRGIHIKVTDGLPKVSVFGHVYASARSAALLVLPVAALGQKYYSMNYTQSDNGNNFIAIVACEDNTVVNLTESNGNVINIPLLQKGDVYEYLASGLEDFTGISLMSNDCKKFAVFSGTSSTLIQCANSRDPLIQQLYPIESWGKNYGIVPFADRRYLLRILAQEDNTVVNVNGQVINLNKGKHYESPILSSASIVTADKLISVAQYSLTQNCSSLTEGFIPGDPEMVLLNPVEFNINKVTLFTSSNFRIEQNYINVFMRTDKTDSFRINGALPSESWVPLLQNPEYSYIQMRYFMQPLSNESVTLTATDGFNAVSYGFGNAESYAYSAGTNLASSQYLTVVNPITAQEAQSACVDVIANFKVTFPYLLSQIVLTYPDGTTYTPQTLNYTTINNGSQTLYTYFLEANKSFNTVGEVLINANITFQTNANNCFTGNQDISFVLNVDQLPTAQFMVSDGCENNDITFLDQSTTNVPDRNMARWFWDFGDGVTSNLQNPKHNYTTSGVYEVKLSVGTVSGCMSTVVAKQITVNPQPTGTLAAPLISCINSDVVFTINSAPDLKKFIDYGNGPVELPANTTTTSHQFTVARNYRVVVYLESISGCMDTLYHSINILGEITSDFEIPEVCVSDNVLFVNKSANNDGTSDNLTYQWDFGERTSGTLNFSTGLNGVHRYATPGTYQVKLTVINAFGCQKTSIEPITVNASSPMADFEVLNVDKLCSGNEIQVINKSAIAFGSAITKLIWEIDGVSYPVEEPIANQTYRFPYPELVFPITEKNIAVTLTAYSGALCYSSKTLFVNVYGVAKVTFNPISPVCANDIPIVLSATETTGISGIATYTGTGVVGQNQFDPRIAGVGTHRVTYTFTTTYGCVAIKTQDIIVNAGPKVYAGEDLTVLEGGEVKLNGVIDDVNATYQWTPSLGLNSDRMLNPIASPAEDTKYILTASNANGCITIDEVMVKVLKNINIPNTFTPNGDGINDIWIIRYLETYPNVSVEIFARSGERIFYSKGYRTPFDGNYGGKALPVGTYYYIIKPGNGLKNSIGNLTIIR